MKINFQQFLNFNCNKSTFITQRKHPVLYENTQSIYEQAVYPKGALIHHFMLLHKMVNRASGHPPGYQVKNLKKLASYFLRMNFNFYENTYSKFQIISV